LLSRLVSQGTPIATSPMQAFFGVHPNCKGEDDRRQATSDNSRPDRVLAFRDNFLGSSIRCITEERRKKLVNDLSDSRPQHVAAIWLISALVAAGRHKLERWQIDDVLPLA